MPAHRRHKFESGRPKFERVRRSFPGSSAWPGRTGWIGIGLLGLMVLATPAYPKSAAARLDQAREYYDSARAAHAALELTPSDKRKEKNYAELIEAFRRVYLTSPTYGNDTICMMAIGELAEEAARRFQQPRYFQTAIDSYEFLLKGYPNSQFRFEALLAIARIYREDMAQPGKALDQYQRYLRIYPRSAQARQVEAAIAQLQDQIGPPATVPISAAGEAVSQPPAQRQEKPPTQAYAQGNAQPDSAVAKLDTPNSDKKSDPAAAPVKSVSPAAAVSTISDVRFWKTPDYSRVVLEVGQKIKYEVGRVESPDRLYLDLYDTKVNPASGKTVAVDDGLLKSIRLAQYKAGVSRVVLDLADKTEFVVSELTNPYRLVIDVHSASGTAASTMPAQQSEPRAQASGPNSPAAIASLDVAPAKTPVLPAATLKPQPPVQMAKATPPSLVPAPNAPGTHDEPKGKIKAADPISGSGQTLTRALGLKIGRILIDPGHGGHDTGTIGPTGYTEKELVLDVAQRLGKMIEDRLGSEVVYTRDDDNFVSLEERAEMANQQQADLFISIHANSSQSKSAVGIETYYLSLTADPEALEVAARENAVSQETISELQGLVRKIALNEKVDESKEFATKVQASLRKSLASGKAKRFDRGVKKAPFVVLIGANMPAILAEISFLSNPEEEKKLKTPEQRQKIAEALYSGVSNYAGTLSGMTPGVKPATSEKAPGRAEKPVEKSKPVPTQTALLE